MNSPNKENEECTICLDPMETYPIVTLECTHSFHSACFNKYIISKQQPQKADIDCPLCRAHVSINIQEDIINDHQRCSLTKLADLVRILSFPIAGFICTGTILYFFIDRA